MRNLYLKKMPCARNQVVHRAEDNRRLLCWRHDGRYCDDDCIAQLFFGGGLHCLALPCSAEGDGQYLGDLVPPPAPVEEGGAE